MPNLSKAQVRHFRFCNVPAIRMIEVSGRFRRSLVVESQDTIFRVILDGGMLFFCISLHLSAQMARIRKLYALQVMENDAVPPFAISSADVGNDCIIDDLAVFVLLPVKKQ